MRGLIKTIYGTPGYLKVVEWTTLIGITGSAQVVIQALGLISGILVVRLLPTPEYGFYTLANTMLGTMTILADGGITNAVMAQGGKVWQNKERLGTILATGLELRKKFAIGSLIVAIPILFYLLHHHKASLLTTALIAASIVPAFVAALSGTILQTGLTLHQDIRPLQKNNLAVNALRFLLLVLSLFVFPWAFIAILASGLPQIWGNIRLRKLSAQYADWNSKADDAVRKEVLVFVKRVLPGAVYYCLSGQITIWLISILGSTNALAQVGALGRLSMVLNVFNIVFATLIVPRFARLPNDKKLMRSRYLLIQLCLLIISFSLVASVWFFPQQILTILGNKYSNLEAELVLSVLGSCLGLMAGASFGLCSSRAWAIHPALAISVSLASILIGIFVLDISTLRGVLIFNLLLMSIEVVMYLIYFLYKIQTSNRTNALPQLLNY